MTLQCYISFYFILTCLFYQHNAKADKAMCDITEDIQYATVKLNT